MKCRAASNNVIQKQVGHPRFSLSQAKMNRFFPGDHSGDSGTALPCSPWNCSRCNAHTKTPRTCSAKAPIPMSGHLCFLRKSGERGKVLRHCKNGFCRCAGIFLQTLLHAQGALLLHLCAWILMTPLPDFIKDILHAKKTLKRKTTLKTLKHSKHSNLKTFKRKTRKHSKHSKWWSDRLFQAMPKVSLIWWSDIFT